MARAEAAHGLRDVEADVACLRLAAEVDGLDCVVAGPGEVFRLAPREAVGADGVGAFEQRAVARVFARRVVEAFERVHSAEVECEVEGRSIRLIPCRVPRGARVEVEEFFHFATSLVGRRYLCADFLNGKFVGIALRGDARRNPVRCAVLIHGTHLELVGRFRAQVFKDEPPGANARIAHALELYFVEICIVGVLPRRGNFVSLHVGVGKLHLGRGERARLGAQGVGGREDEALDGGANLRGGHIAGRNLHEQLRVFLD